jgi:hypothetical protein
MRHIPIIKLKERYAIELEKYKKELENSTVKEDKKFLKQFESHKQKYADTLLEHYYKRCNSLHKLAFCQFRKSLPNARVSELREIVL